MGLGDLLITGSSSGNGSNLKGFISKFNSSEGKYANTIDPLNTFDVVMYFYPGVESNDTKEWHEKMLKSFKGAVTNVANNLLGGIVSSFLDDPSKNKTGVNDLKVKLIGKLEESKEKTVMDYIAKGNGFVEDSDTQLVMDVSYYVQSMSLPQLTTTDGGTIDTLMGTFPTNGNIVKPTSNSFQMTIVNTKAPLLERLFYPWMREVTLPYWSYDSQPYTTAKIVVDFKKHTDLKYVFVGCRPTNIGTIEPSQEFNSTPTRQVTMTFDYMFVNSENTVRESTLDKFIGLGKSVVNDLGSAFGI